MQALLAPATRASRANAVMRLWARVRDVTHGMIAEDGCLRLPFYAYPCLRHEAQAEEPQRTIDFEKRFLFQ